MSLFKLKKGFSQLLDKSRCNLGRNVSNWKYPPALIVMSIRVMTDNRVFKSRQVREDPDIPSLITHIIQLSSDRI